MILLTYTHICDLCKREIETETFKCSNFLRVEFPRPKNTNTYQIGATVELCNDCVLPIMQARNEVLNKWKEKNGVA